MRPFGFPFFNVDNVESTTVPQFMQPLVTPKVDDMWPFPAVAHKAGQDICEQRLSPLQLWHHFREKVTSSTFAYRFYALNIYKSSGNNTERLQHKEVVSDGSTLKEKSTSKQS